MADVVGDERRRGMHLALVDGEGERRRGEVDPVEAVAAAKIGEARTLDEAISYLAPEERAIILATPSLIRRLGELANGSRSAA